MKKHLWLVAILIIAMALFAACAPAQEAENPNDGVNAETVTITDMAGREVTIPATIEKAYSHGQVSTIMLYQLAPDKLLDWNYELNDLEKAFILEEYQNLTAYGMGDAVNYEAIIADGPQIVINAGTIDDGAIADADALQEQLGIPVVLLNGDLDQSAAAFRFLGEILGEEEQAEALATYAEDTLAWLETAVASVPEDAKVTVYYGNGETSLNTAPAGSSHTQVLDMVGAINVANLEAGSGSRIDVSKEQVLEWNPEVVILNGEPKEDFTANAAVEAFISDPDYATVSAVQNNQVYGSPKTPFSWIDRPPGPNRLIGLRWAFSVIYPDYADYDMDTVTREFYQLFYHMDLTDEQMELLMTA